MRKGLDRILYDGRWHVREDLFERVQDANRGLTDTIRALLRNPPALERKEDE